MSTDTKVRMITQRSRRWHRDLVCPLLDAGGVFGQAMLLPWANARSKRSWKVTTDVARSIVLAVALVTATTLCLVGATYVVDVRHISIGYLIPVLVAAIGLGILPAILAAVGGVAASAYLFYAPVYDFRISDPQHILDLVLFVIVATVTGQLASRARAHAIVAKEREGETRAMYAFSRRLAVATDPTQIYSSIQDHLTSTTGCPVLYFEPGAQPASRSEGDAIPQLVWSAVREFSRAADTGPHFWINDEQSRPRWLLRPVSRRDAAFGLIALDFGRVSEHERVPRRLRIDAALDDAVATLGRLDMVRVIEDAKLRAKAETLRAALISSVSHELRTPLASIMGSASILAHAPAILRDSRLAALAGIVRDESERLNHDIQKLLDATQISSAGVSPQMDWADPADIVNAAVARQRSRLDAHSILIDLPEHLPLVLVDPVLVEQALGLILDNAAKYSPDGSTIWIMARSQGDEVVISVRDEGVGLSAEERSQIFERFFRGPRTQAQTPGSGLGLWIARAFLVACGARVEASSEGIGCGTTVTIALTQPDLRPVAPNGEADE
jgi:two-component system, OmpR family, sensor histidine kinase KdpD